MPKLTINPAGFITITPGKNAASVEVRANARYAVLPDFFADDVVFDPVKFAMPALSVPAENFLLQFIEGGSSIVMCIWPGNLKLPGTQSASATDAKTEKEGPDPQVDLVLAGEARPAELPPRRIEFQGKPVYVGLIEQKKRLAGRRCERLAGVQAHAHRVEAAVPGQMARRLRDG